MVNEGFSYIGSTLHCEGLPLQAIAEEVGTPLYIYSKAALTNRVARLKTALQSKSLETEIYFAVKANSNTHLLRILASLGCGTDVVSGGELFRAMLAGIGPEKIGYSGVGKTLHEIDAALKANIHAFQVESLPELEELSARAVELGTKARVHLRFNPDVNAKTHPHIATGLKNNKFGLSRRELLQAYKALPKLAGIHAVGLSCHIGSQITKPAPFEKAWKSLLLAAEKAPFPVEELNLGGGLGISYGKESCLSLEQYGRFVAKIFAGRGFRIELEPGRALAAPTGVLVTRVVHVKDRGDRRFCVVDAAMNDLIRPALYGATHRCVSAERPKGKARAIRYDIVGPVCESADTFERGASLPEMKPGALLVFSDAGAYGMSMSSQYNSRPRAAEVLVDGAGFQVIRTRETYADLVQHELL